MLRKRRIRKISERQAPPGMNPSCAEVTNGQRGRRAASTEENEDDAYPAGDARRPCHQDPRGGDCRASAQAMMWAGSLEAERRRSRRGQERDTRSAWRSPGLVRGQRSSFTDRRARYARRHKMGSVTVGHGRYPLWSFTPKAGILQGGVVGLFVRGRTRLVLGAWFSSRGWPRFWHFPGEDNAMRGSCRAFIRERRMAPA